MENTKVGQVAPGKIVKVDDLQIGGGNIAIMAGPCAIESFEQTFHIAKRVQNAGANILRGGAFKPRTSPHSFQGLGLKGLKILNEVGRSLQMPTITEVLDVNDVELVAEHASILQIGARNMQNFELLKAVGRVKKPVMLKRGLCATIEELLLAAEYIMKEGNEDIILCERGIRTFETCTRNTLSLAAIPAVREKTGLPIVIDPSHATGKPSFIPPLSLAAIAAGADGLMIEVHNQPEQALCDGAQALRPEDFADLMGKLESLILHFNKNIA